MSEQDINARLLDDSYFTLSECLLLADLWTKDIDLYDQPQWRAVVYVLAHHARAATGGNQ